MTVEEIDKYLKEYFNYIKEIFCTEFSKYMTKETKKRISNLNDVIKLNPDLCFKTICNDNIIFNLNLKLFIEKNNLKDENSIIDLSDRGKKYIKDLIENEDNIYKIIQKKLAKEALILFMGENKNVLVLGTIELMLERLKKKYNIQIEEYPISKEKDIALYFSKVVGEDVLFSGIINQNEKIIKSQYNLYVEENELDSYDEIISKCNKIYLEFNKKIGKEFFSDSLYGYEHLDYMLSDKIKKMEQEKNKINVSRLKRLISIKDSLLNINEQKFLFSNIERLEIENSIIEINKIMEKLIKNGKDNILNNIGKYYNKILEIENDSVKYSFKIWKESLTDIEKYKIDESFGFLIGGLDEKNFLETVYITSEHLNKIRTIKYNYGFIYEPLNNGIIYASYQNMMCKEYDKKDYIPNYHTIYSSDIAIESDNQDVSKLITPSLILKNNLESSSIQNKVILEKNKAKKVGIYCFINDNLEDDSNYNKALELKEEYNLPIVVIKSNHKFIKEEKETRRKIIKEIKREENIESLFEKMKNFKDKILYEDKPLNNFKKTL